MPPVADNRSDLAGDEIARAGRELEGINRGPCGRPRVGPRNLRACVSIGRGGWVKKKREKKIKKRREIQRERGPRERIAGGYTTSFWLQSGRL